MIFSYKLFERPTTVLTAREVCEVAAAAALVALAAGVLGPATGDDAAAAPERPLVAVRRDRTLTKAYSIRDEKTNTRQTIIQMSIACHRKATSTTISRIYFLIQNISGGAM